MRRSSLVASVAVVLLAGMAGAALLRWWGAFALAGMLSVCALWYRYQVRRTDSPQAYHDEVGEETRMASVQQGGSPSELAADEAREGQHDAATGPEGSDSR